MVLIWLHWLQEINPRQFRFSLLWGPSGKPTSVKILRAFFPGVSHFHFLRHCRITSKASLGDRLVKTRSKKLCATLLMIWDVAYLLDRAGILECLHWRRSQEDTVHKTCGWDWAPGHLHSAENRKQSKAYLGCIVFVHIQHF